MGDDDPNTETRIVQLLIDPALDAYLAWIDAEGAEFDLRAFDLFAAGYRARDADDTDA